MRKGLGTLFFCAVFLLVGTSSSWGSEPDGVQGYYVVPVTPASLMRYAIFSDVRVRAKEKDNGLVKLGYQLPRELVGSEQWIEFEGRIVGGVLTLSGDHGEGECDGNGGVGRCALRYKGLTFDHDARELYLQAISKSGQAELMARRLVAEQFEGMVQAASGAAKPLFRIQFGLSDEIHGILDVPPAAFDRSH